MLGNADFEPEDQSMFEAGGLAEDPAVLHQNYGYLEKHFPERNCKRYMIPEEFPDFNKSSTGKAAEKVFFDILKQIDEPMLVMYEYRFCAERSCVIDFMVIHKTRGIMIFEVKAGNNQRKRFQEAFSQAQKFGSNIKLLMSKNKTLKMSQFNVSCYAVLPNCRRHKTSRPQGVYKDDLVSKDSFLAWLNYFRKEDKSNPIFSNKRYDDCLGIFADKAWQTGESINLIHDGLNKLTPKQESILNGLPDKCYVAGPAGTGKTELMIYKASESELSQQSKLIVVYNSGLAEYLKWRMEGVGNLKIATFSGFLIDCIQPFLRQQAWSGLTNRAMVEKAIQVACEDKSQYGFKDLQKYDNIFVDEAQLLDGRWEVLLDLLHNMEHGHYKLIFFDNNQKIRFTSPVRPKENENIFYLTEVIRNSRNIFEASKPFIKTERCCRVQHDFIGPEVIWNHEFTDSDLRDYSDGLLDCIDVYIHDIYHNLGDIAPMDICVLVENKDRAKKLHTRIKQKGSIIAPFYVENMVESLKHQNWYELFSSVIGGRQCGVVVDSIGRYTGLGSKVVILVLSSRKIYANTIENIYVGITRASSKLIVIQTEGEKRKIEDFIARQRDAFATDEPMETNGMENKKIKQIIEI